MHKQHSIKVPQLYKTASNIYKKVKDDGASLKNLVYETNHPNKKAIYALVLTTIQRDSQIDYVLKKSQFLSKEPGIQVHLTRILIAELLWGKKRLSSDCRPVKTILAYEQTFHAYCIDVQDDLQCQQIETVCKPRFVRVNTLKMSVDEAIAAFRDEGWIFRRYMGSSYQEFLEEVCSLKESEFMSDLHVKDLLLFPPRTQFYKHIAYRSGDIILQDKASCLPAILLNPPPGAQVLDMCAAPGMKTTQLAALVQDTGKVFAVEKDSKRMETLREMVQNSGATCIETIFKDVLTVDSTILPDIEYILVDPSCSGTGITDRIDIQSASAPVPADRITKLSGFQIMVLKHAMRAFPKAKRIVYSTCSVLPEENEVVVQEVISTNSSFKLLKGSDLLKSWDNFGSNEYDIGQYCIYARPEHDLTNGFFVAVFERFQEGANNEFLNPNVITEINKEAKKQRKNKLHKQLDNNYRIDDYDMSQKKTKKSKSKHTMESLIENDLEHQSEIESRAVNADHESNNKLNKKKRTQERVEVKQSHLVADYNNPESPVQTKKENKKSEVVRHENEMKHSNPKKSKKGKKV